jgi:NifU-like protein involved in Fe-S cluster formation
MMDQVVVQYYRKMLRSGFEHAGSLENPSVYVDSIGERIHICGLSIHYYMNLYINIGDDRIGEIKYLCTCEPTTNVAAEVLCNLVEGKTLAEAAKVTEKSFSRALGSKDKGFLKKARDILELMNRGLARYQAEVV